MEGFKVNPKMAKNLPCYKEGGSVKYKSRHSEKQEESKDIAKDKAIVKKAVKIHDEQLHEGKETNLSKLKKGGRMKKEGGCVGRYKSGGGVSYGAKKSKQDIKEIAAIKRTKPKLKTGGSDVAKDGGKATGGADIKTGMKTGGVDIATGMTTGSSDVAKEGTMTGGLNNVMKKGGRAKKYADGGIVQNVKAVGKKLYENVMGTPEQNKAAAEQEKAIAEKDPSSYEAKYRKMVGKKEGGKACR